jgi:hypothetical protein
MLLGLYRIRGSLTNRFMLRDQKAPSHPVMSRSAPE